MIEYKDVLFMPVRRQKWDELPDYVSVELTSFLTYEYRINGIVYTEYSQEFEEEFQKERLFTLITGPKDPI